MTTGRAAAIEALLRATEQAHSVYERDSLSGVYDEAWPRWYAARAVEDGIGALVGHSITADRLARFLARCDDEFKRVDPSSTESWAAYTARRIAAQDWGPPHSGL